MLDRTAVTRPRGVGGEPAVLICFTDRPNLVTDRILRAGSPDGTDDAGER
jgi:hypothetical protein